MLRKNKHQHTYCPYEIKSVRFKIVKMKAPPTTCPSHPLFEAPCHSHLASLCYTKRSSNTPIDCNSSKLRNNKFERKVMIFFYFYYYHCYYYYLFAQTNGNYDHEKKTNKQDDFNYLMPFEVAMLIFFSFSFSSSSSCLTFLF